MPARRATVRRDGNRLTPELLPKAERLMELHEAHHHAIETGEDAFYEDGRHEELVNLAPIIHRHLGIKPWHDRYGMLREALERSKDAPDAR